MSDLWSVETLIVGSTYSSTCTLVANDRHRVIIDSGLSLDQSALSAALRARRLDVSDVDIVINTHLHLDHCSNNSLFPRAVVFMSRRELQWTSALYSALFASRTPEQAAEEFYPELRSYNLAPRTIRNVARLARLFWNSDRLGDASRRRWIETDELPRGLEVRPSPGHTPFHLSIRVAAPVPLIVAGDAVLAERLNAQVRTMIPYSRADFLATREALIRETGTIVPGHGPIFSTRPDTSANGPQGGTRYA